jgi:hypothetical protein
MNLLFSLTTTKNCPLYYIRQLTYVMKCTIFVAVNGNKLYVLLHFLFVGQRSGYKSHASTTCSRLKSKNIQYICLYNFIAVYKN